MSLSKPLQVVVGGKRCMIAYGERCRTDGCNHYTPLMGGQKPHETVVWLDNENFDDWLSMCIRCAEELMRMRRQRQKHSAEAQRERAERWGTRDSEDSLKGGAGGSGSHPKMGNTHGAGGSLAAQRRRKKKAKKPEIEEAKKPEVEEAKKPEAEEAKKPEVEEDYVLHDPVSNDTSWADDVDA